MVGTGQDGMGLVGIHNANGYQIAYLGSGDQGSGFSKHIINSALAPLI